MTQGNVKGQHCGSTPGWQPPSWGTEETPREPCGGRSANSWRRNRFAAAHAVQCANAGYGRAAGLAQECVPVPSCPCTSFTRRGEGFSGARGQHTLAVLKLHHTHHTHTLVTATGQAFFGFHSNALIHAIPDSWEIICGQESFCRLPSVVLRTKTLPLHPEIERFCTPVDLQTRVSLPKCFDTKYYMDGEFFGCTMYCLL